MANYTDYKKVDGASLPAGVITDAKINANALNTWNIQWVYGTTSSVTGGCCCLWTVPTGVYKVTFELWGSGGNGHGFCSWDRCHHYRGAGGGYYASKTITTAPGCQYTVCAAGVYPCCSVECVGCYGCASYVNGYNLSGFCAVGGHRGEANTAWNDACNSTFTCCKGPNDEGADFGMGNHAGQFGTHASQCHCHCVGSQPTPAPFIGGEVQYQLSVCWERCGCWTVPFAHGATGGMTTYCGNWDNGTGGTGGSGVVKISYI